MADKHSVATEEGAAAIVQTALDAFGGVDILVNNAGISIAAPFDEMTSRDFRRHIDINLMGPIWTCRAAWPHMRAKGYGRIVNITSGALAGFTWLAAYGASKGGLLSLTRSLAAEGASLGIKVNAVNPGAFTRMVAAQQEPTSPMYRHASENLPPELVSPVVAFLAHEECPVTGECIEAVGGEVRRIYMAQTAGFTDRRLEPGGGRGALERGHGRQRRGSHRPRHLRSHAMGHQALSREDRRRRHLRGDSYARGTQDIRKPGCSGRRNDRGPRTAAGGEAKLPKGLTLVSADNHVELTEDIFYQNFPARLRDAAPRVWFDKYWRVGFKETMEAYPTGINIDTALTRSVLNDGFDFKMRNRHLDAEGIAKEIVYPQSLLAFIRHPDQELQQLMYSTYNEWIAKLGAENSGRFYGVGICNNWWDPNKGRVRDSANRRPGTQELHPALQSGQGHRRQAHRLREHRHGRGSGRRPRRRGFP